ncbi:hypothetical protein JZ751_001042 [Albula glossodonta]|uniref:Uncharacterized protein n=1 Tax=Albula glossodonta TaxID=121402 RepID=A0A8T2PSE5_9TELE|nr:hypothetical protein JZ751_001042 [Albula glossodonta]
MGGCSQGHLQVKEGSYRGRARERALQGRRIGTWSRVAPTSNRQHSSSRANASDKTHYFVLM